jgi:hypothetical protein
MNKWTTYARGRTKIGEMNGLETKYSKHLESRIQNGEILWFDYEGIKFRLAKGSHYTPDFAMMMADGTMECHETKGYWRDNGRTKIKIAAEKFPFRFIGVQWKKKQWEYEEF